MKSREFALKYGQGEVCFSLPAGQVSAETLGKEFPALPDVPLAVAAALNQPIDSPPLGQMLKPRDTVVIAVSDITRTWQRMDLVLPPLIKTINEAGIPDGNITIIVALGTHRANSPEEIRFICGDEIARRIKVVNHDPYDRENMVYLGKTSRGTEVEINSLALEADRLILTGGIIYHYFSGYGGGRKSVIPGLSSVRTIQQNHLWVMGPTLGTGANPNCRSGKTRGNECHEDMMEVAGFVQPDFVLNVVPTPDGGIAGVFAGNWVSAWEQGARLVDEIYAVPIPGRADIVIASAGGFPKDINLYQTGKPIDNAYMAVKENGVVIMVSECRDVMEPQEFSQWFQYKSMLEMEAVLRENCSIAGLVAWKMLDCTRKVTYVMLTRPENTEFLKRVNMISAAGMDEALAIAYRLSGKKEPMINVMPQCANTLPVLAGNRG